MKEKQIVFAPHILLPKKGTDMTSYAVIACDQFTSQVEYWDELEKQVGDKLSTLHMIYPEAYLENTNQEEYINKINNTIKSYLANGSLVDIGEAFVLVERTTSYGVRRLGLVAAIDLEEYSYKRGAACSIKASEATIEERIPPRLKIRKDAAVELPHTLLLFDDVDRNIVEPLYESRDKLEKLYDFDLNQNGGHVRGYKINNTNEIINKFQELYLKNNNGLMFVVGDGNHSLATAKSHWENLKKTLTKEQQKDHPARFALVELNNVYDEGIIFEPIHRVVFNANKEFVDGLLKVSKGSDRGCYVYDSVNGKTLLKTPKNAAETYEIVQEYIDKYIELHPETKVDFIHDESSLLDVANKSSNSVAIHMPALGKGDIFEFVAKDMVLPRKSFSMGHANEKRYYLEAKKIVID